MPPRGFVLRPPLALSPSVCKGAYFDALCVLLRMRYSSYPLGSRHGALVLGGEREKRRRGRKRKKVLCGFFFFFFEFFFPDDACYQSQSYINQSFSTGVE